MAIKEMGVYENPFRPNYEKSSIITWGGAAASCYFLQQWVDLPPEPMWLAMGIAGGMMLKRLPKAIKLHSFHANLKGKELEFITSQDLQKKMKVLEKKSAKQQKTQSRKHAGYLYMGSGFNWDLPQAQRMYDMLRRNRSQIVEPDPDTMGSPWIHALEPKVKDIIWAIESTGLMTGIFGAPGSGKTRLLDLISSQFIMRGECVIFIDPKGDKETEENAKRACELSGQADRWVRVHRSHPETSARIDTLKNFVNASDLATRIISSVEDGDFKAFAHMAANNAIAGTLLAKKRPTYKRIKRYLESDFDGLIIDAISGYAVDVLGEQSATDEIATVKENLKKNTKPALAMGLIFFYEKFLAPVKESSDLESLIHMYTHDRAHLSKVIMNLFPILTALTSGAMGPLLSPDADDLTDEREITDTRKIIENNQVAYIGLDTLSDQMTGQAFGTNLLADFTATAGQIYAYYEEHEKRPVNIFIDEASEVASDQLIQMLNKSRGAGFRVFVFTQSTHDFAAKLGDVEKANVMFDNFNNLIALRCPGNQTQEFITNNIPPARIKTIMETQGTNSKSDAPLEHTGNIGERLMEEEVPAFPPQMMGLIPNFEYIAKLSGGQIVKGRIPFVRNAA